MKRVRVELPGSKKRRGANKNFQYDQDFVPQHVIERKKLKYDIWKKRTNKVNIRFYSEEFFIAMLNLMRIQSTVYFQMGYKLRSNLMLNKALSLVELFENAVSHDIIRACIKIYMFKARLEVENNKINQALTIYKKCIDLFTREISILFNFYTIQKCSNNKHNSKVRASVTSLIITIMNMVKIYERFENITKIIELTQLGYWFMKRFIDQTAELFTMFSNFKAIIDHKYRSLYLSRECITHVLLHTSKWWNIHLNFHHPGEGQKKSIHDKQKEPKVEIKPHVKAQQKLRNVLSLQGFIIKNNKKPKSLFNYPEEFTQSLTDLDQVPLKPYRRKNSGLNKYRQNLASSMNEFGLDRKNYSTKMRSHHSQHIIDGLLNSLSAKNHKPRKMDKRSRSLNIEKVKYNRDKSGLVKKVLKHNVNAYIPDTKVEKAKNHFHDRVEVDAGTLTTIHDYFLNNKQYKKLQNFTKALLVERFGGYYTLMKLKEAKPKVKWVAKLEKELAEDAQHLSELYGYLNEDQYKKLRLKARQNRLPPEIDMFFEEVVDRGLNKNKTVYKRKTSVEPKSFHSSTGSKGNLIPKSRVNDWAGAELVGDDGLDNRAISKIKGDAMLREYVEEIDAAEFEKFTTFFRMRGKYSGKLVDKIEGVKDFILEEWKELQKADKVEKIENIKKKNQVQKWKRDIYRRFYGVGKPKKSQSVDYYQKKKSEREFKSMKPSQKKARILKLWKKALKSSLIMKRRINIFEIMKRHPDIFKMDDITFTRQKMWKLWQNLTPEQQKNPTPGILKGLTPGQVKIIKTVKYPRKGPTEPFVNYFNTKNNILKNMQDLNDKKWNHPQNEIVTRQKYGIETLSYFKNKPRVKNEPKNKGLTVKDNYLQQSIKELKQKQKRLHTGQKSSFKLKGKMSHASSTTGLSGLRSTSQQNMSVDSTKRTKFDLSSTVKYQNARGSLKIGKSQPHLVENTFKRKSLKVKRRQVGRIGKTAHVKIMNRDYLKPEDTNELNPESKLMSDNHLAKSLKDLNFFSGVNSKIKTFDELMDICKELVQHGINLDDLEDQDLFNLVNGKARDKKIDPQLKLWRSGMKGLKKENSELRSDLNHNNLDLKEMSNGLNESTPEKLDQNGEYLGDMNEVWANFGQKLG